MPLSHTVHELALTNGARGLLIDVPHTTAVAVEVYFRAGNEYVADVTHHQTAHIMEHMSFGINQQFDSPEAFSQEFSKNGASYNATTWARGMSYSVDAAIMEWDRIIGVLELAVARPLYTEKVLKAEKGNVREELSGNAHKNARVLWQHLYQAMGDPSLTDAQKIETIDAVTIEDIQQHFNATHTMQNMRFIIAGDLGAHADQITKKIDAWPLAKGVELPIMKHQLHTAAPLTMQRKEVTGSRFALSISLNRELSLVESNAMDALNFILTETFHSRIFGKARSQGICYNIGSSTSTDVDGVSMWEFYGQVSSDNAEELFALVAQQLRIAATEGVSQKELDEAIQYALGGHQLRSQTVRGLVDDYFDGFFDYGEIRRVDDIPKTIQETSLAMMTRLASEFLRDGVWTMGTIGEMDEKKTKKLHSLIAELFVPEVE